MLDRQEVLNRLRTLDWLRGFSKEGLLRALLDQKVALPNEFLSAIQPTEIYNSPEQLVESVPDVVWTIHSERERRARGRAETDATAGKVRRQQA